MVEDRLLKEYVDTKRNPRTRELIQNVLRQYANFTGKTITQLIEEAEQEEDNMVRMRSRKIKEYITGFKDYLEHKGDAPSTIKSTISKVRSLYIFYEIQLPQQRFRYQPEVTITADELPSREDIEKAINHSNDKYRAIILIQISSGMGSAEIASLTGQHLADGLKEYKDIAPNGELDVDIIGSILNDLKAPVISWKIERVKTSRAYYTFSTPEALRYIHTYLEYIPPISVEDYLFPGYKDQPLQNKTISQYYKRLNDRMGWGKTGRQAKFRSHNLRKVFSTLMEKTPLGYDNTRRLLGHAIAVDQLGDRYIKSDPEHLKFLYRQSMYAVTIMDKVKVHEVTDERIHEMEKEMKLSEAKVEKLEAMVTAMLKKQQQ